MFCVYITTYNGAKLPSKYIGSSSVERVDKGYRGSVRSAKWSTVWVNELRDNPQLFETQIVSVHNTREDALIEELRLQRVYDVVSSDEWINESFATVNGFFGRDVTGALNPNYGRGDRIREWCANNPEAVSERNRKAAITQWQNKDTAERRVAAMKGTTKTRKTQTQDEFVAMQKAKSQKSSEKVLIDIEYLGKIYRGWQNLFDETGVTKHLYKKYYLNGIDPLLRKGASGPANKFNMKGGSP